MPYRAGIDLGTTFTAAAVSRDGETRPEVVSLGDRAASVPSVVLLRDDATVLTGDAANRRAIVEPDRVAREFKRRLGDPTPLLLGGSPHSAESLQAKMLRSVYDSIVQIEGRPPETVAVTYPANWGPYKKELLTQMLRMAGLATAITVTEPVAAAIHYASTERVETGEVIGVYDLGGGTFDAAVLRKTADGFEILGTPEGLEHLGGIDFDHSILQHVNSSVGGALDQMDLNNPTDRADLARLRADCAEAKEALSTDTEVTIPVSVGGNRTEVRLTRAEFDEMVRPAIDETTDAMRRAISSAGVSAEDVSRILLVGGASRMPIVSRMVGAELGRPVSLDAHPKHAIALGAATVAASAAAKTSVDSLEKVAEAPPSTDVPAALAPPHPTVPAALASAASNADLPAPPVAAARKRASVLKLGGPRRTVAVAVVVTLLAAGSAYTLFLRPTAQAGGVLYQDPVAKGPSPFTEPAVVTEAAPTPTSDDASETPHGPFGGTGELTKCNKSLLKKFLNENPDRKKAWTEVLGVELADFDEYFDSLRKAVLSMDTRVTNHGFKNGKAFELQSILAKGTAVLVDDDDNIVTRCYCGNPLTPPKAQGSSTCNGCPENYSPPEQCSGNQCFLLSNDSGGGKDADSTPSPESDSGRRTTQSQPSTQQGGANATPTVITSNNGENFEPDDDSNDPDQNQISPQKTPAKVQSCAESNACGGETL